VVHRKRRSSVRKRRTQPKRKTGAASSSRAKPRRRRPDLQERVFQVFAEQVDSLWSGLTDQCRQFADGFNNELGGTELRLEADETTLRAAYPRGDAELFVTLDRSERYLQCWLNTGCATYGTCLTNQTPVGLTVKDDALRLMLAGEVVSDEQLAITLLTQLTSGDPEPEES
jgi:hypothetical protein